MEHYTHFAVIIAVAIACFGQANAGDTLYFKAESVKTDQARAHLGSRSGMVIGALPANIAALPHYYIVQFRNKITQTDRRNVESLGARIVRYMPDDSYVFESNQSVALAVENSSPSVRAVLPYQANWKVSEVFAPASVFTADQASPIHVRLFPGANTKAAIAEIAKIAGVQIQAQTDSSVIVNATPSQIDALTQVDGVEWVQPQPKFDLLDFKVNASNGTVVVAPATAGDYSDLTGYESGTKVMNFDAAYARGYTGHGQIASMADTGLDTGDASTIHQDFTGRVNSGLIFGLYSKSWEDPMGHGTHVSGSIMGSGQASGRKLRGAAYDSSIVVESLWSPMLSGLSVPTDMNDMFNQAYATGTRVHSDSWGSAAVGAYDAYAVQVDTFVATHPDMLVVIAAGNAGVDADKDGRIDPNSIGSPATAKNVLTVGASKNLVTAGGIQKQMKDLRNGAANWGVEPLASSTLSDNPNGLAAFSSRGPTADGRFKPEVVAPGTNILSVHSRVPDADPLWGLYNNDYAWSGGTSMSTPLVAGAATVLRQYLVNDRKIADPSAALMKAVLMHTAFDMYPGQFGEVGQAKGQEILTRRPNSDEGFGRVDMDKATNLSGAVIVDDLNGLATGESHTYPIQVSAAGHLTATLVYTDAPALESAAKTLVNDLDLSVVVNGQTTSPNDHTNNSEIVEIPVAAGTVSVTVNGTNVPQGLANGKQPYALLISVY
jgi:subtilisin family serine protease